MEASADSPLARYELKVPYAEAVLRAGGLPFVLPYSEDPTCVEAYLDRLSGVLITGGASTGGAPTGSVKRGGQ